MTNDPQKIVLLGESCAEKTDIISVFSLGYYDPEKIKSLTAQFIRKTLDFEDGKSVTLDIWDTAGQHYLPKIFLKDANAIILVYDITNKKSFTELKEYWYQQIKRDENEELVLVVAGNKNELCEQKEIADEEAEEWAKSIGAVFFSISAKNGNRINEMFDYIGKKLLDPKFDYYADLPKKGLENKTNEKTNEQKANKSNKKNKNKDCLIF